MKIDAYICQPNLCTSTSLAISYGLSATRVTALDFDITILGGNVCVLKIRGYVNLSVNGGFKAIAALVSLCFVKQALFLIGLGLTPF